MRRLRIRVPAKDEWRVFFDPNISGGGIFCPTNQPPEVGSEVSLEISFSSGPRFFLGGTVVWRRPRTQDPRTRAGVGIQIHAHEQNKVSYINAWVRGGVVDKRELRRLPVRLRATYQGRLGRRINFTRDLSEEGIFLRSKELLDVNSTVDLTLVPPKPTEPFRLQGVVSHHEKTPSEHGMGIRLLFRGDDQREAFAAFVATMERRYLGGKLPDEVVS
jgi:Tfp pilus assembly protein PilZ